MNDKDFKSHLKNEVMKVWEEMTKGCNFSLTEVITGEDGPRYLRARLPAEFRDVPLAEVRSIMLNGSRSRQAARSRPNRKVVPNRERHLESIKTEVRNGRVEHSDVYKEHLSSEKWATFCRQRKEELKYRCQGCGNGFTGHDLEIHHIHYDTLGYESSIDVLVVCAKNCHPVMDWLRSRTEDDEEVDLNLLFKKSSSLV